jgi:AMMECR1 domain-containing protein
MTRPPTDRAEDHLAGRWVGDWVQRLVRLFSLIVLVGALGFGFKACHQLPPGPRLTAAQMQQLARVARSVIDVGVSGQRTEPASSPAVDSVTVSDPVFVSVYRPDSRRPRPPVVGRWEPTENTPTLPATRAVFLAASEAADLLAHSRHRDLGRSIVKVDLAGPVQSVWLQSDWYLRLVLDPGRDGLRAERGEQKSWFLPSWGVERGGTLRGAHESLEEVADGRGSAKLSRFRTTSFVEAPGNNRVVHHLYRGNVLLGPPSVANVHAALVEAGRYLARMVDRDGRYCYEYRPEGDRCAPGYNLLRHAGTTYSLFQLHRYAREPAMLGAAERATEWLRRRVRAVHGDASRAFLLEGDKAKLGAVGLTLIALVEREKDVGDGRDRQLMTRLASFVISQQREDGYFQSYFAWKPGIAVPERDSIYYPGEALLGLVRLHGIDPQPRYLHAARLAAEFLVKRRWRWAGVEVYVPPDAWLAQALSELDAVAPADWLRDYAYEIFGITEMSMLRADEGAPLDLAGGPASGFGFPRVTPAGSRTEGTGEIWRMARRRGERERAGRVRDIAVQSARFQLNQQYRPENSYFLPNPRRARGGFRGSPVHGEVRIDYVQHNVSGLLIVLEMLEEAGG